MKKNFYIFLDIDGVLFDIPHYEKLKNGGNLDKIGEINKFKPESIKALNKLIKTLKNNYDVNVVITSLWRFIINKTIEVLKYNKLENVGIIKRIQPTMSKPRSELILEFLTKVNEFNNYVIIDDQVASLKNSFHNSKIIETSMQCGLNQAMVDNYIANHKHDTNIEIN